MQALSGKHVVFGALVGGEQVLEFMEQCASKDGSSEEPAYPIVVADCGVVPETLTELQRHQCGLTPSG